MASGDSIGAWDMHSAEQPSSNFATWGMRNNHLTCDFDSATQETIYVTGWMPQNYSDATGVTIYLLWTCAATTGSVGWDVAFERISDGGTDIDADSFATAQTVTAESCDGTSGKPDVSSVAITKGANMDGTVAGDMFRLQIRRDVSNDDAAGDANLLGIEMRET